MIGRLADSLPELGAGSLVALTFLIAIGVWMCGEFWLLIARWHLDRVRQSEAVRVRPSSLPAMRIWIGPKGER